MLLYSAEPRFLGSLPAPFSFRSCSGRPLQLLRIRCFPFRSLLILVDRHFVGEGARALDKGYRAPYCAYKLRVITEGVRSESTPFGRSAVTLIQIAPLLLLASLPFFSFVSRKPSGPDLLYARSDRLLDSAVDHPFSTTSLCG